MVPIRGLYLFILWLLRWRAGAEPHFNFCGFSHRTLGCLLAPGETRTAKPADGATSLLPVSALWVVIAYPSGAWHPESRAPDPERRPYAVSRERGSAEVSTRAAGTSWSLYWSW